MFLSTRNFHFVKGRIPNSALKIQLLDSSAEGLRKGAGMLFEILAKFAHPGTCPHSPSWFVSPNKALVRVLANYSTSVLQPKPGFSKSNSNSMFRYF